MLRLWHNRVCLIYVFGLDNILAELPMNWVVDQVEQRRRYELRSKEH